MTAGSERAAGEEVKGQRQLLQRPAAGRKGEPRAQQDDAGGGLRRAGFALPVAADAAQEVGPGRRRFVERLVTRRAVVANRGSAQQRDVLRADRRSAATTARVASTRLSRMARLRAAVHRPAAIGSPARLTTAPAPSKARTQSPPASDGRHWTSPAPRGPPSREHDDVVGVAAESLDERSAKEAGSTGHNDFHDSHLA